MKNSFLRKIEFLISDQCIFYTICFLLIGYGISDIVTSPQTYHKNFDRTFSKVFLVLLLIALAYGAIINIISVIREKKKFPIHAFIFPASIVSLIFFSGLSSLVNFNLKYEVTSAYGVTTTIVPFNNYLTNLIYYVLLFVVSLYFETTFTLQHVKIKTLKYTFLSLFFIYFFLCVFYFFYLQGKPLGSLAYRIPIISHIFFPFGMLITLKRLVSPNQMMILLLIFAPLVFIADKMSVLLIFIVFFVLQFLNTSLYKKEKKVWNIIMLCIASLMSLVLLYANLVPNPGSFLEKFTIANIINSSGRLNNWINIINNSKNPSLKQVIFGYGSGYTMFANSGTAAHNDYLEFYFSYGLVGLFPYLGLLIFYIVNYVKNRKNQCALFGLIVFVTYSLISAVFVNSNLYYFTSINIDNDSKIKSVIQNKKLNILKMEYDELII